MQRGVFWEEEKTKDIVDNNVLFGSLPTRSRATYDSFVHFAKLLIKNRV